jgi:tRNA nucleotidyltransferase (CCA-adding enzyme)
LMARLGWQMDERTAARYETGKAEEYISAMDAFHRGYETEEIFHEEDPLRVLRRLEGEGWMKHLFPALMSSKVNVAELDRLRESQMQLVMQGINPETSAANFPYLTAKMAPKDLAALKKSFPRHGFAAEIAALESEAKAFAAEFSGKGAATPSQAWKLLHMAKPESVLWVAHTSKNGAIQAKFKGFFTEWSQAKQKIPYLLMQEMRITPDLPVYKELVDKLFFELMDNKLGTPEEMKAYLEPYSPPAPPPPVHLRRARLAKKDAKPAKTRRKAAAAEGETVDVAAAAAPSETKAPVPAKGAAKAASAPTKIAAKAAALANSKVVLKEATKKAGEKAAKKSVPAKKVAAKKAPAKVAVKKAVAKKAAAVKKAVKAAPATKVAKKASVKVVAQKAPAKKPAPAKKAVKKAAPAKKAAKRKR